MRLLDYQIKPVVIFDGVMRKAKWGEIWHRRDQREKLWQDNANNNNGGKDGPSGV
jgi:hypothetical protein